MEAATKGAVTPGAVACVTEAIPTRMFLYCWQPKTWTTRAVLVPLDLLSATEQERIASMHSRGPIFWKQWKSCGGSAMTADGYRLADGQRDNSTELAQFLGEWQYWADHGDREMCLMKQVPSPWQRGCLFYWMNDELGNLEPQVLHKTLCSLTSFDGQPVDVQYCILETELEEERERSLRFYYTRAEDCSLEDLCSGLLPRINDSGQNTIMLSQEKTLRKGYGFVGCLSSEQVALLDDATLQWDGNTVMFR